MTERQNQLSARPSRARGFTLVELLLSASLGAVLLIGAAHSAGLFAETVVELEAESDQEAEVALARMAADIRYAWWVEVPSDDVLRFADPQGLVSEYSLYGGTIRLRAPDGDTAVLATDVADLVFTPATIRRYRDGSPVIQSGTLHTVSSASVLPTARVLEQGDALILGFMLDPDAGTGNQPEVREEVISLSPTTIELPLARASTSPGNLYIEVARADAPGRASPETGGSLKGFSFSLAGLPNLVSNLLALLSLDDTALAAIVPTATVPLDISQLSGTLEPGVGYVLGIRVFGSGARVSVGGSLLEHAQPDVSLKEGVYGSFAYQPFNVPFRINGTRSVTSTTAHDVVAQVHIALTTDDGAAHEAAASVLSQVLTPDPWLGVVPGESPETSVVLHRGVQVVSAP